MFVSVYGMKMHEYYQVLILTVVFGAYLLLVVLLRPFRVHANQRLQAASTALLLITSLCMLTFIKPDGLDEQQQRGYEGRKTAMGVVVRAVNALFVAVGLALLVASAVQLARRTLRNEQAEHQGNVENGVEAA
uniref:TRP C-terminal domain-containing protein n=1 Tax=Tetradesmus obliquus TaxID=3088 RepID=A0A383W129_TETOB|eukprot:jgi/Sobl393_1/20005/SZX71395.1